MSGLALRAKGLTYLVCSTETTERGSKPPIRKRTWNKPSSFSKIVEGTVPGNYPSLPSFPLGHHMQRLGGYHGVFTAKLTSRPMLLPSLGPQEKSKASLYDMIHE